MFASDYKFLEYECIDSSNDEAKRLIRNGEIKQDTVIIAREQTSGHGRYGRTWKSPAGNLYCSVVMRASTTLQESAQISFVAAVSLGEALEGFFENVQYKWPNDVLVNGDKLAGILIEAVTDKRGDNWVIVGVGLNVKSSPKDVDRPATSLDEHGIKDVLSLDFLHKWLPLFNKSLNLWYKSGFTAIRDSWMVRAYKLGDEITIKLGGDAIEGVFVDVTNNGELELNTGKNTRLISSGEVFF